MDTNMKIRWTVGGRMCLAALMIAMPIVLSCSDPESPPIIEEIDRSDPDNLLLAFAKSYREKDLEAYSECLCGDFRFHFTEDIADSLRLPPEEPWWGKTEDLSSTGTMFESPNVTDIRFTLEYVGEWIPCADVRADSTYEGLCRRIDPLIEVANVVDSEDPILKIRVDGSWLDVMVMPDPDEAGQWCILSIKEVKKHMLHDPVVAGGASTEPASWGAIKARFFQQA